MKNNTRFILFCSALMMTTLLKATVDPTRPPGRFVSLNKKQQAVNRLNLQGLVVAEKSWIVLNEMVIKEGRSRKGIDVIKVERDKVLVRHKGKKFWLKWQTKVIKKNSKQSQ